MRQNSKKTSFDKLFEDVMGDDVPMDMEMGMPEGDFGDEEGLEDEEGEDVITLELPRDVAEVLHSTLGELLGGEEEVDDIEDLDREGIEDESGDGEFQESHVDLQPGPADAVSKLATQNGGNNKVAGEATPVGGGADTGSSGQEDGGKPKPAGDGFNYANTKNNKVGGKITGGNKQAFKA